MKKILLSLLFLVIAGSLLAQPMHYNYLTGAGNTFPLGQTNGKASNWLFPSGSFNLPTPCLPGQEITKVYFRMYGAGSRTYTNLHIWMAQTTLTNLTTGTFFAGAHDTVFVKDTSLTSTGAGTWLGVKLHTPYPYDPTKALVLFVGQCGAPGSGMYILQTAAGGVKRTWSVGGCPFTPYAGGDGSIVGLGIDVQSAAPPLGPEPEIIYYKFEDNPTSTSVINYAIPGQGTSPANVTGASTLTSGGQFDSCLASTGASNGGVVTGWNCNLGMGSWTISTWMQIPPSTSGSAYYLFGDGGSGSFRCFHNGVAYNGLMFRGNFTQVLIPPPINNNVPVVIHFVYDSAATTKEIKVYKDGAFLMSVPQSPLNIPTGSGFRVGGYGSSATGLNAKLDEFRIYSRALDSAEIAVTWNRQLPVITGIPTPVLNAPDKFNLSQNYPNPFNPSTKIDYQIPYKGLVILKVYDILGKEVATLVNEVKQTGNYTVTFNASSLPSGTYFYRLEAGDNLGVKKMILLK